MSRPLRVILLGKTGAGKSSLGNTMFGENVFTVSHSPNSETSVGRDVTRTVHGRSLTLIDTPGVFDTNPNRSEFGSEMMRCLEACAPGPHAFLLVLNLGKYTQQEQAVVDIILKYFSDEALRFTTVVFTHGDELPTGTRILKWAQQNATLRDLLHKCGNRCFVVDNQRWSNTEEIYRNNQNQVKDLLDAIDGAVAANGGSHFTNDLLNNPSLWSRFRDAPTGVQVALLLGVPVVGCLLYAYVPWAQVSQWVVMGAKNGPTWIWKTIPAEENIKSAIAYLSAVLTLFQTAQSLQSAVVPSSGSFCTIL